MSQEKEKLLEIGLNDLGRFAIGQESNALYFDNVKVRDTAPAAGEDKLKSEIRDVVSEVVSARFDRIESLLTEIRDRLSLAWQPGAPEGKERLVNVRRFDDVEALLGKIHNSLSSVRREVAVAAKAKRKQFRRHPSPTK
jgi:hypothetical protein